MNERQLASVRELTRSSSLFDLAHPASLWLLSPPEAAPAISAASLGASVLSHIDCSSPTEDPSFPASHADILMVPLHHLPEHDLVLGTTFTRTRPFEMDYYPPCYRPAADNILRSPAYDSTLSNFVLDCRDGCVHQLAATDGGGISLVSISFGQYGPVESRAAVVEPNGDCSALTTEPQCEFCEAHIGKFAECTCPRSMRERRFGRRVALQAWDGFVQLGLGSFIPSRLFAKGKNRGVRDLLEGNDFRETVSFTFTNPDLQRTVRGGYVDHLSKLMLRLTLGISSGDGDEVSVRSLTSSESSGDSILGKWRGRETTQLLPASSDDVDGTDLEDMATTQGDTAQSSRLPPKSDKPRAIVCEDCGKDFATPYNLSRHMAAAHRHSKAHKCDLCGKAFAQQSNLKRHQRVVHEGCKPFACKLCDHAFATQHNLHRHEKLIHKLFA